jgi:bacteriocin-like protein
MKQEQPRVMAYHLAKEISNEELDKVSGGTSHMSQKNTVGPTGSTGALDAQIDISIDW